jgi:hypothetical protein
MIQQERDKVDYRFADQETKLSQGRQNIAGCRPSIVFRHPPQSTSVYVVRVSTREGERCRSW